MLAAVYERTGSARDVLDVRELPDPLPGPGEVRVRIEVSGVNPTDWKGRSGAVPLAGGGALPWPYQIPHQDGAGVVDAVGDGVPEARVGERVWVYHAAYGRQGGTAAQLVCVPQSQAVPLPEGVPLSQGAGLGIPYLTAHRCLFAGGSVAGATVLVTGGAGAVGNAAIQLARWAGARVVATVSSQEKADLAERAGAHDVIDYRSEDVAGRLRHVAPGGLHRVVDVAVAANLPSYASVLRPRAGVAAYAAGGGADAPLPVRELMVRNASVEFVLVYTLAPEWLERAADDVTAALEGGALQPLPEHRYALEDIAAAHEAVERAVVGKVLVHIP